MSTSFTFGNSYFPKNDSLSAVSSTAPAPGSIYASSQSNFPLDRSLFRYISNKSFFYGPFLDIDVMVDLVLSCKPNLYWGHDMCLDLGSYYFVSLTLSLCSPLCLFLF